MKILHFANEKPNIAMFLCRDAATNLMISLCAMFNSILNMNAVIFKKNSEQLSYHKGKQ